MDIVKLYISLGSICVVTFLEKDHVLTQKAHFFSPEIRLEMSQVLLKNASFFWLVTELEMFLWSLPTKSIIKNISFFYTAGDVPMSC